MPTSNIVSRETDETLQLSPPLAEKFKNITVIKFTN